jgi:hypothetical protein
MDSNVQIDSEQEDMPTAQDQPDLPSLVDQLQRVERQLQDLTLQWRQDRLRHQQFQLYLAIVAGHLIALYVAVVFFRDWDLLHFAFLMGCAVTFEAWNATSLRPRWLRWPRTLVALSSILFTFTRLTNAGPDFSSVAVVGFLLAGVAMSLRVLVRVFHIALWDPLTAQTNHRQLSIRQLMAISVFFACILAFARWYASPTLSLMVIMAVTAYGACIGLCMSVLMLLVATARNWQSQVIRTMLFAAAWVVINHVCLHLIDGSDVAFRQLGWPQFILSIASFGLVMLSSSVITYAALVANGHRLVRTSSSKGAARIATLLALVTLGFGGSMAYCSTSGSSSLSFNAPQRRNRFQYEIPYSRDECVEIVTRRNGVILIDDVRVQLENVSSHLRHVLQGRDSKQRPVVLYIGVDGDTDPSDIERSIIKSSLSGLVLFKFHETAMASLEYK